MSVIYLLWESVQHYRVGWPGLALAGSCSHLFFLQSLHRGRRPHHLRGPGNCLPPAHLLPRSCRGNLGV